MVVRGKTFLLTKSQIEFDSPNYFTTCFLGDFREAQTRRLNLSRSPEIFEVILDYLCGYKVLPLGQQSIPSRMSPEAALINLRADAAFYQLDGLIRACEEFSPNQGPHSDMNYVALLGIAHYSSGMETGNVLRNHLHHTTRLIPRSCKRQKRRSIRKSLTTTLPYISHLNSFRVLRL